MHPISSIFVLHALTTLNGQKSNAVALMPLFIVVICVIKEVGVRFYRM